MDRPREFDEKAVLDATVDWFWRHGYDEMSVQELSASVGTTADNLLVVFGDKQSLFERALGHYLACNFEDRGARFVGLTPRDAIVSFFNEIVERSVVDEGRKGYLLVNAGFGNLPHDAKIQEEVARVLAHVEGFFRCCVAAGQTCGQISRDQSADDLAGILLSTLLGIRVLARARPERALLEGLLRPIYALLADPVA
ncbi:TetR/AcrR family transcriptional regulator [Burkholderia sp. Ac-20365]|uniref:TetR/AcrR family transcriptional regulator n=1 Tax=Burkholderia sp. Ac-20365 TaxID=2703897 RepID=UPI00197C7763|nr:TetR/AcrR family transcriptional regulator [Burkholderia sp. Ac-20365]MBN3767843.1 TetR/AcrR family transcriptional regulator [Burkholderia sp. Ac-20365]